MAKKTKNDLDLSPAQVSSPAKETTYLIKDNFANVEIEMSGENWRIAKDIFITAKDYQQAKESAAEGEKITFKAGQRRYEFIAYKEIGTEARLSFADAQMAFKNKTHTAPKKCSSC